MTGPNDPTETGSDPTISWAAPGKPGQAPPAVDRIGDPGSGEPPVDAGDTRAAVPQAPQAPEAREVPEAPEAPASPEAPATPQEHPDSQTDEAAEFEGARRRARRERAARRAAQQRARAIEEARREAKRQFRDRLLSTRREPVTVGSVRGLRSLIAIILAAITTTVIGLVLYFSPLLSARAVEVIGTDVVATEEVLDAARIRLGTPLLQVNTAQVAERVAAIRRVARARVQRRYPSAMRIIVAERIAVAVKDYPDGPHLFDRDGVDFATDPPPAGVAYLDVDDPGPGDPATRAALHVLTALRPGVADQIGRIAAPSVASITLTLVDNRTVVWGGAERTAEKAEKLTALLTQPGQTYDVSSPDLPTVR